MVADLAAAERLALLGEGERALLAAPERPIVLATARPDSPLCPEVAPRSSLVGLLIAYTPLHHLLLVAAGRPLVATSGNLSEEPIAAANAEALRSLGGVADLFLLHDRSIASRCDDSVARLVAGKPVVLRRARGYVPRAVRLRQPVEQPVLACGAQLKNAPCLAVGDAAYLGPHVGDLESLETCQAFGEAVAHLERLLGVEPRVVAHDLHAGYHSTRWALERPAERHVAVQHHHAHVAAAMAEHGLEGPVLGLAWDGTGDGGDGTAWGGELLLATYGSFSRLATFRPLPLAGGDLAIREVWRLALVLLDDAFDGHPPLAALPLFDGIEERRLRLVRRMVAARLQTPLAHGVGRYFDALGALGLARPVSRYEGQVAMEWNLAADPGEGRPYPFALAAGEPGSPLEVDLRPLVRALVADLLTARALPGIAGRFHATLATAAAALVEKAAARYGRLPVVLTGGCFQNPLLAERVRAALVPRHAVHTHGEVPPGDGGLALGQALVADAVVRGREGQGG
jgi:hydrogenase maturation protein HypF